MEVVSLHENPESCGHVESPVGLFLEFCILVGTKGSQLFNFSIVGKNMQKCT